MLKEQIIRNCRVLGVLLLGAVMLVGMTVTTSVARGEFALGEVGSGTILYWDGEPLVVGESFDLASGELGVTMNDSFRKLSAECDGKLVQEAGDWDAEVAWGRLDYDVSWAREAAVKPGRAELTFAALIEPYDRGSEVKHSRYQFSFPVEMLKGAHYRCWYGMHRSGRAPKTGTLTGDEEEEKYFLAGVRYMQLTQGPIDMFIDLNPTGVWGIFLEDPGTFYKAHFKRVGDRYVFVYPSRDGRFGGKMCVKMVLRSGVQDVDAIHLCKVAHYVRPFHSICRVQFTDGKPMDGFAIIDMTGFDTDFAAWQLGAYDAEAGRGWVTVDGEMISPDKDSVLGEAFSGGVAGKGKGIFRVAHPNGRVMVNVMLSGARGGGAVACRVNGGKVFNAAVEAGERETLTVPAVVRDGIIDVELDGKAWMLSGTVVQMLMTEQEDYLYDRNWWVLGKAPWQLDGFGAKADWAGWPREAYAKQEWPY